MRSLGLSITEFKKGMHDVTSDDDEDERIEEERKEPAEKV
jgi:Sec-independent protein translocase protein TatA